MNKGFLILIVIIILLLPGCGFKDIDKRFLVVAIGVDQGVEKKYNVTLKLIIPTTLTEPGKSNSQLVSMEADSISEALELMRSQVDKQLDLGHAKVTIFGKSLAQKDITKHIDWFIRRRGVQRIEYIAVAESTAKEILSISSKSERLAGNSLILSFGHEGTESSFIVSEYLYDFYERLLEKGRDPFMPVIKIKDNNYEINQIALFDKKKIKLILDPNQTRILNQLLYKQPDFEIRVIEEKLKFSLSVHKYHYRYQINRSQQGQPTIDFDVRIKGTAEESEEIFFHENWGEIEQVAEHFIENAYLDLLTNMQKMNLDPIGFGLRYMATRHEGDKEWADWKSLYPQVKFNMKVKVTLEGTGEIK